jgi:hypothetical protein
MTALDWLLGDTTKLLGRYLVLNEKQRTVIALWVAHTHVIEHCHTTPYLLVRSPEKRSGKSRLLETLALLVCRPWSVTTPSAAALFRKLAGKPCLLLDETDAVFSAVKSERNEDLRSIIDSGWRPGVGVPRCVGPKQEVVDFEVFGPKVLAGINNRKLPDTIEDRCVTIEMQRKTPTEKITRFRRLDAEAEAEPIRAAFEKWAAGPVGKRLSGARPEEPSGLNDRMLDSVEILLAIADEAGGEWPQRARSAIRAVVGAAQAEDTDAILALRLIEPLLAERDAISSAEIAEVLNADDEAPFGAWRKGEGIDARGIARLFKPFSISSKTVRLGDGKTAKGYTSAQLRPYLERYIPALDEDSPSQRHKPSNGGEDEHFSSVTNEPDEPPCDGSKTAETAVNIGTCDVVTANGAYEGSTPPDDVLEQLAEVFIADELEGEL